MRPPIKLALSLALLAVPACGERDMTGAGLTGQGLTGAPGSGTTGDGDSSGDDGGDGGGESTNGATPDLGGDDPGGSTGGDTGDGGSTGGDDPTAGGSDGGGGAMLDPPEGESSGGAGGGSASGEARVTSQGGVTYRVIAPGGGGPHPFMIVYSGTEGGAQMTSNIQQNAFYYGWNDWVFAIIDGTDYFGNGQAGAHVLDQIRADYDIDNDRTYLLSESAGTSAGLKLGLQLRQSYFAAYWANDVNASLSPSLTAADLGFAPHGNAGPGGDFPDANAIVAGMAAAGYRLPTPAPYDGPGAGQHGSIDQFHAALEWFPGKTRQ